MALPSVGICKASFEGFPQGIPGPIVGRFDVFAASGTFRIDTLFVYCTLLLVRTHSSGKRESVSLQHSIQIGGQWEC